MNINELLRRKGFDVVTVPPQTPVRDVVRLLRDRNLGAVVVSTDGHRVEGIVSERDVVRHLADGTTFLDAAVADIMTAEVTTCRGGDPVQSLMGTMTRQRIRHLPVTDADGQLVGIISIGDVVKSHITQLEFERDQLEGYLTS